MNQITLYSTLLHSLCSLPLYKEAWQSRRISIRANESIVENVRGGEVPYDFVYRPNKSLQPWLLQQDLGIYSRTNAIPHISTSSVR